MHTNFDDQFSAVHEELNRYRIHTSRQLESGELFFTRRESTGEHVVIKKLSRYKDSRYDLETLQKRQQCQLEALHWNKRFTSEVYLGLGRICEQDTDQIVIDEIIESATAALDSTAEYALLMRELPESRRLDSLLAKHKTSLRMYKYLQLVIKRIAEMHESLAPIDSLDENGVSWGSWGQLERKLQHNLDLFELALLAGNNDQWGANGWLIHIFDVLKEVLLRVFAQSRYRQYFEQRVREHCIKRCHGDLKVTHIWIESDDAQSDERCVQMVDAIDFNPAYCNIDVLSDFAMLVIDVQAYAQSALLADSLVEHYLKLTGQQDEVARAVLSYYLVEKAMVSGIVSIAYNKKPELGLAFLRVAERRVEALQSRMEIYVAPENWCS